MTKEWNNNLNPFNSMKSLIWREHFEGFAKKDFLPPLTVDIDPSNRCNYDCIWCNAYDNMCESDRIMTRKHLLNIADFCAEWGVKSACVAGGGEPLLNKHTGEFLQRWKSNGMQSGIVTNGRFLHGDILDIVALNCRWVGVSMDAGTPETYNKVKNIKNKNAYHIVCNNIKNLATRIKKLNGACEIGWKYLLHPYNALEIFESAKMAKECGVRHFGLRPVGYQNITKMSKQSKPNFEPYLQQIDEQIDRALNELEEPGIFEFFGVRHKFSPDFDIKCNFGRCWSSPFSIVFGADGNCYICSDRRACKKTTLCMHKNLNDILEFWNSKKHHEILDNLDVKTCPRCTFGPYNNIVEHMFLKDETCRYFP